MTDQIILAQAAEVPKAEVETVEEIIKDVSSGIEPIISFIVEGSQSVARQFLSYEGLYQLAAILSLGVTFWLITRQVTPIIRDRWPIVEDESSFEKNARNVLLRLFFPALCVIGLWIFTTIFRSINIGNDLIRVAASLLQAWVLIRLFSTFVKDPFWSKTVTIIAWFIAALNILRLLNPTIAILDSFSINVGDSRLSFYIIIKGFLALAVLIWLATFISKVLQSRINQSESLTPSARSLFSQVIRIGFMFGAVMIAMNTIGVDLTAFAVFSGAIGVGIGFGLQAIFSNLVAGVILLMEHSIKVGDFVELESGLTGEVREINTRATLITTNDNVDILVPNAEFINNRVTNWTFRDNFKRTRIPFGVAYGTDTDLVKKAALEAAESVPHMLKGPGAKPPEVWLVSFGESSLDFELVVWIKPESVKRPAAVNADYNWALEKALTKYGIEIPFPQRDLHIRTGGFPIKLSDTPNQKKVTNV